jgi:S1-C subfamily serine protease
MDRMSFSLFLLAALIAVPSSLVLAGEKPIKFETVPPGAQVEVNGSVVCTTPCSFNVPSEYLSYKWAFSKHAKSPIVVRLLKEGCATKTVNVTEGPLRWRDSYGIPFYRYYQASSPKFTVQLDSLDPSNDLSSVTQSAGTTCGGSDPVATKKIIASATQALVTVMRGKSRGRGFLISTNGLIVTDGDLINEAESVKVLLPDGRTVKTEKLFVDLDHGIGLLKIEGTGYQHLKLSTGFPEPGSDVFTVDPPNAGANLFAQAVVSDAHDFFDLGMLLIADRPLNRGDIGSPLLDRTGQVVAINTLFDLEMFKGQNVWEASPEVDKFVRSHFKMTVNAQDTK